MTRDTTYLTVVCLSKFEINLFFSIILLIDCADDSTHKIFSLFFLRLSSPCYCCLLLLFVCLFVCLLLFVLCTHRYISGANFFGEIIEWFGFALASNFSLSSITFLIFTIANLAPRAKQHHDWYLNKFQKKNKNTKFQQYPKDRTALIPFVW